MAVNTTSIDLMLMLDAPRFPIEFRMYTVCIMAVLALHASIDALCTVSTIFNMPRLRYFMTLYPSMFLHSYVREDPLICRLVIYTAAAMSLVRCMAVLTPFNPPVMILVGIMYILESLICLYEMDTAHTANSIIAGRVIHMFVYPTAHARQCILTWLPALLWHFRELATISALFMALVTFTHAALSCVL